MSEENLWGEISVDEKLETPVSILRSQAVTLNKVTKGLLDGRVVQVSKGDSLIYEFRMISPSLGNYSVSILKIAHDMALYPVAVLNEFTGRRAEAHDPESMKEALKTVLQSDEVRRIVRGLVAQAVEPAPAGS